LQQRVAATRIRYRAAGFGIALAFISYLDRAAISQAAPLIVRDLHLTTIQMGYVFSAFGLSYAALEIPSGWWIDRRGARTVLTRVVYCWSFFTAATGWAWNFPSLFLARLLFGAGESGCFPGIAKSFRAWLPPQERAMAEGWKAASARWGAAMAPPLVVALYAMIGWRLSFTVFGVVGAIWAILFYRWYRDDPKTHQDINAEELRWIELSRQPTRSRATPWAAFFLSRSAWALWFQWFCHFFGFYFFVTWLPTYLQQARGLNMKQGAYVASLPMISAGFGTLAGGWMLPRLAQRWGLARARKALAYVAYLGASALLFSFPAIRNAYAAMSVLALSSFVVELSTPATWTAAADLGGESVGLLTGAMNTLGHLGGSLAPSLIAYLLVRSGNDWSTAFYCSATLYAAGALCWAVMDPVTPLDATD
jgi:ACS family glucarate transporter-like MFS transporter